MKLTEKEITQIMLNAIIQKHGLMLNSKQCAIETRATKSTRGLDEDRKKGQNVPEYIDSNKSVLYPVQKVVEYHLSKSQKTVKVNN